MFTLKCDVCQKETWTGDLQYEDQMKMCPECYQKWLNKSKSSNATNMKAPKNEISQITIIFNNNNNV